MPTDYIKKKMKTKPKKKGAKPKKGKK